VKAHLALAMTLLASAGLSAQSPAVPNVAATVNGEAVRLDQVDVKIRTRPTGSAPLSASQVRRLRTAVVEDLIDDVLFKQFLAQNGPPVSAAEMDKHFQALAVALKKQGKTPSDYYRELGQTEAQTRETWTAMLKFQKYAEGKATDAELKKHFEANREFFEGAQVRVSVVMIRLNANALPGERATASQKLLALREQIAAGTISFADAAKKHSEDPSAPRGGDLGWIARRDTVVDEPVAKEAFARKVNELGEPVATEFGSYLVLATERKPGKPITFEKALDQVRDCFLDDLRQNLVANLRSRATIQVTVP